MKKLNLILIIVVVIGFICCNNESRETEVETNFISPAFSSFNIAFEEHIISSEVGDTIFSESGSILIFPPNSLIDEEGNLIKGEVKIMYRDFKSPLDFFIAGIPMGYDSNGTSYTFESSAMCEIYAFQGDRNVFINPENKPELNLISDEASSVHNLYYLDTIEKKWNFKGKDLVFDLDNIESSNSDSISYVENIVEEPFKPQKPSGEKPVIEVIIDDESGLSELFAYNNLKFEIDQKEIDSKYVGVTWDDVKVERTKVRGKYMVIFTKGKELVKFNAIPVVDGKDYDEAMKIFEKKNQEYQMLKKNRLKKEKEDERRQLAEVRKLQAEQIKEERLRQLVETRNKQIEENNRRMELIRQRQIEERRIAEQTRIMREQVRAQNVRSTNTYSNNIYENNIYRTFSISNFGIWNVDAPFLIQAVPVLAEFYNTNGDKLKLKNVNVVYKDKNAVVSYFVNKLELLPDSEIMIWAVKNDKFIYITYEDFKKYNITQNTDLKLTMREYPKVIRSKLDLLEALEA
jgi:hypothetical protein